MLIAIKDYNSKLLPCAFTLILVVFADYIITTLKCSKQEGRLYRWCNG